MARLWLREVDGAALRGSPPPAKAGEEPGAIAAARQSQLVLAAKGLRAWGGRQREKRPPKGTQGRTGGVRASSTGRLAAACAAALLASALAGCGAGALRADNNFHTIVAGQVYRSAQPSATEIAAYREQHGIATIINLRGKQEGRSWYKEETRAANKLGIRHIDFAMSPQKEISAEEARTLIALMRDARKPLLIHCMAGSDRAGLASALYLAAIAGAGEEAAEQPAVDTLRPCRPAVRRGICDGQFLRNR